MLAMKPRRVLRILVNLSNDNNYVSARRFDAPFTRVQLTLLVADVEALVWRRNVIAPGTLFVKQPVVRASLLRQGC